MLLQSCGGTLRCSRGFLIHSVCRSTPLLRYSSAAKPSHPEPHPTIAIVGSGPAGFYTAQKLVRELPATKIHIYERLPVPFGLVRYGVAPDHPEVKNVEDSFRDVANSPNFKFVGNVNLGEDIPLPLLAKHYDALVFAYGASKDRKLGLVGEDRPHVYSARAFVGWYNGLPEYRDLNPVLSAGEDAVVIGQGNVALDVARTLLTNVDSLRKTDITDYALKALSKSTIKHVRVVGRRGPLQAAFTIKEVRELLNLQDVSFTPIPAEMFPPDIKSLPRAKRRIMELLQKGSATNAGASKSWSLDFLLSPTTLSFSNDTTLDSVAFTRNQLTDPSSSESKITSTSEQVTIAASTLFRSIGYKAEAIPGFAEIGISFDDRKGTITHDGRGRAMNPDHNPKEPHSTSDAALYCSGWVKRGPTGVIASTMADAFETAEAIIDDWKSKFVVDGEATRLPRRGWEGVKDEAEQRGIKLDPVHWDGWDAIDRAEKKDGESKGKPREKFGTIPEMLDVSRGSG